MAKIKVRPFMTEQLFDYKVVKDKQQVPPGCIAVLEGYATLSDDRSNKNKHYYPKGFWDSVLNSNDSLKEKLETRTFFGSFKHPGKDESPVPDFGNISHNIREYRVDDKGVYVVLDVFDTEQGRELKPLLDYGSKLGISTRAYGEVEMDGEGYKVPLKDKYMFITWDLVSNPAFSKTRMNKVSDSVDMEIEIEEELLKSSSKEAFLDNVKKMKEHDAKMLCDYMGYDFSEIADSFKGKNDIEAALDQAMDVIKKLEEENKELRSKNTANDNIELLNKVVLLEEENKKLTELGTSSSSMELSRLMNSVLFLKEKLKEVSSENTKLVEGSSLLKSLISDKNRTIEVLEDRITQLCDAVEELKKTNKTLQKVNDSLEEKILETAESKNTFDSQLPTNVRKNNTRPMFRVHSGEKSQVISDEAEEMRSVISRHLNIKH